jgi:hypothetical protein
MRTIAVAPGRALVAIVAVTAGLAGCRGQESQKAPEAAPSAAATTTTTTTTTLPPPPPVWRGARWGMAPAEVLAAFPGEAQEAAAVAFQPPASGAADVAIPVYDGDGARFRVLFGFASGTLDRIQLSSAKAGETTCYDIEQRLTAEHGEPASRRQTTTNIQTKEVVWSPGTQTVTLACAEKPSLGFRTVTLDYAAPATREATR